MDDTEKLKKFLEIQAKFQKVEDDDFVLDRLSACDTTDATNILKEFLSIK